ncbi:peptidylprolyl isomerase [Candidatus Woesearchaeota archaeon]|nr:MAG: peptidylprolyl isomerase [Candidatus Woesearchaeota archaeon]
MAKLKKGDFVEIEYTGWDKDSGEAFDTTDKEFAKKENLYNENMKYGPVIVCVGESHVIKGLDKHLEGKETGSKFEVVLKPEEAFGKKDPKLLRLVPRSAFAKENINPVPGLQVNVDGMMGMVRTVSGGRILIDFNHPLASREIKYEVKVNKIVDNVAEKIKGLIDVKLNAKADVKEANGNATISLESELPEVIQKKIEEDIKKLIPEVKSVKFRKKETKEQQKV